MSTPSHLIQSIISFLLFITISIAAAVQQCPIHTPCGPTVDIRFPFGIHLSQPNQNDRYNNCTYPGFNVSCVSKSNALMDSLTPSPLLHLPNAGNFTVQSINYLYQQLYISDPNDCFPRRLTNFNLTSSPFRTVSELQNFVFLTYPVEKVSTGFWTVTCLSNENVTVIGLREGNVENAPEGFMEMERVRVPKAWVDDFDGFHGGLLLQWDLPGCRACEDANEFCGLTGSGLEVGCLDVTTNKGMSKTLTLTIILLVAIILGTITLISCTRYKINEDTPHQRLHRAALEFSTVAAPHSHVVHGERGLQQPTLESYPNTRQSKRSPKPIEDGTCPICLCEYHGKAALRTLPECNHYFHARCIDEWLKVNATCPVCRADTPDRSSTSSRSSRGRLIS